MIQPPRRPSSASIFGFLTIVVGQLKLSLGPGNCTRGRARIPRRAEGPSLAEPSHQAQYAGFLSSYVYSFTQAQLGFVKLFYVLSIASFR